MEMKYLVEWLDYISLSTRERERDANNSAENGILELKATAPLNGSDPRVTILANRNDEIHQVWIISESSSSDRFRTDRDANLASAFQP